MSFLRAGKIKVKIIEATISDPKFPSNDANAFDVCLHVVDVDDPSQSDWWRGEVSGNYGTGNSATKTRAQMTYETLDAMGFQGQDFTKVGEQLTGTETILTVVASEKDGTTYYNARYIGPGKEQAPDALDPAVIQARTAAILGGPAAAVPPATVATPVAAAVSGPTPLTALPGAAAPAAGAGAAAYNPFKPPVAG